MYNLKQRKLMQCAASILLAGLLTFVVVLLTAVFFGKAHAQTSSRHDSQHYLYYVGGDFGHTERVPIYFLGAFDTYYVCVSAARIMGIPPKLYRCVPSS